jgi:hypothetical protein
LVTLVFNLSFNLLEEIVGACIQRRYRCVTPKPADLAAGVSPRENLRLRNSLSLVQFAAKLGDRLRVADGAARRHPALQAQWQQSSHLFEQALSPHICHSAVEPVDEDAPVKLQRKLAVRAPRA